MRTTTIIIISAIALGFIAYYVFFPQNTFISFSTKGKREITFSRTGVQYRPAPDFYPEDGFEHIASYISKLIVYSDKFKSLIISTPDGCKALGLDSRAGIVSVGFTVDRNREPEKERMIRDFFKRINIDPIQDYSADNGGANTSTHVLEFNIQGNEKEITVLVKDILKNLCDISKTEALDIYYEGT